jgi:hypothetical protein
VGLPDAYIISTVTATGRKPLVSEFRKIVEVPIHIWEPHFVGENFNGYIKIFTTYKCLVAFAGSTLIAQHVINNITGHLGKLRIDHESGDEFTCIVKKSCDANNLISNGSSSVYNDDIFIPERDYQNLLTAEFVSDLVEHSINKALESKMRHVIDQQETNKLWMQCARKLCLVLHAQYKGLITFTSTHLELEIYQGVELKPFAKKI